MKRFFSFFLLLALSLGGAPLAQAQTPTLSIADATISEGNSGFRELLFPISLSATQTFDVSASFVTKNITASNKSDYLPQTVGQVVFKAGATRANILIRVVCDTIEEKDESFLVQLGAPKRCAISDSDGIGVIKDDDYSGQISVGDVSVAEGDSGQRVAKALVRFSKPALHDISVRYEVKDGTAKAGSDYLKTQGTLLFKPGRVAFDVLIPIVSDGTFEGNETCFADILVTGLPVHKSRGVVTILNDDEKPMGKIAYSALQSIYVANADGTNVTALTHRNFNDRHPNLSRDGRKITFTSGRDLHSEIYVMNADGTQQTRLTRNKTAESMQPVFSFDAKKITFCSRRDGNDEIYVMDADGTNPLRLTTNNFSDTVPTFSPDGAKIAFVSNRDGDKEIYVMNSDGSDQVRLTDNLNSEDQPSFSPDGARIVFSSNRDNFTTKTKYSQIYVMNADGGGQRRITQNQSNDNDPTFSPDGKHIAFTLATPFTDNPNFTGNQSHIYLMNADGTGQTPLSAPDWQYGPSWSLGAVPVPTPVLPAFGSGKIAFSSSRDNPDPSRGFSEIYVMNTDGSHLTRLTTTECNYGPNISPDGTQIVYSSAAVENSGIWIMNADGSNQRPIKSPVNVSGGQPHFSRDGQKIVFVASVPGGTTEIYVMNADGSDVTRITNTSAYNGGPAFSPDGQKIVFHSQLAASNTYPQIYSINVDGTDIRQLTTSVTDVVPSFAPEGNAILFSSSRYFGARGVYVMNTDGTGETLLSYDAHGADNSPAYSPDGNHVVFVRGGFNPGLFLMNANGTGHNQIPGTRSGDTDPHWGIGSVSPPGASAGATNAAAPHSAGSS